MATTPPAAPPVDAPRIDAAGERRILNVRPDTLDFRDRMYEPTLVEVPPVRLLAHYQAVAVPVLDQQQEGACTGFGLATVANYLLRMREVETSVGSVSPRMLYEMAKRYDEWPGERYEGSSARGAMKGWHKHGVASQTAWPYVAGVPDRLLTDTRARDAAQRPLGSYFRVNHKDLVALHSAISEVGVLYATSIVHVGWEAPDAEGVIPLRAQALGGHAFAIVGYDRRGLWIQNSWGSLWGRGGCALITYDDWLRNGTDVWVARLGAPVELRGAAATATSRSAAAGQFETFAYADVRPHVISLGNDGRLSDEGTYGTSLEDVKHIVHTDIPRITQGWQKKRVLLYAHGGLVSANSAIQRVAEYREALSAAEVYPLAFVWHSDYWTTLTNILAEAVRSRRPEGLLDDTKDFMLDRLDDALEPLARALTGKAEWDEMKENALGATVDAGGGARAVVEELEALRATPGFEDLEIHVVGHSAGSILLAPLVQWLTADGPISSGPMTGASGLKRMVTTCTLWAPACTIELFDATYGPALTPAGSARRLGRFSVFALTDDAEQDDHCANIYHKSLLYLVSNAFEQRPRIPVLRPDGEAILGMEKFVTGNGGLKGLVKAGLVEWVAAPNAQPVGSEAASRAQHHGDFDDDQATVRATLARILGRPSTADAGLRFHRSVSSLRDRRRQLV